MDSSSTALFKFDPTDHVYTLLVAGSEYQVNVHESVLTQSSRFLQAAVKTERVQWLYSKGDPVPSEEENLNGNQIFAADLYLFSEKILDEKFARVILQWFDDRRGELCGEAARILYLHISEARDAPKFLC
ncbi:hypothetical protein BU23DRAFT_568147 [Bimuria novae-zelandiae CBS 107.79]|uniref:Uncharacterized protein n=1 Tax=Bimuria novae-zelandiae CBS 107.79 TaxID=1447943 RepID=A0A6A5V9B3_9PLEO|nr:hypothetical protein BU23DRAFT_568147 [Bimuria novae-zelandiae CBS 107.79]